MLICPPLVTKAHQLVLEGAPPLGHNGLHPVGLVYDTVVQQYPFNSASPQTAIASLQSSCGGGLHCELIGAGNKWIAQIQTIPINFVKFFMVCFI